MKKQIAINMVSICALILSIAINSYGQDVATVKDLGIIGDGHLLTAVGVDRAGNVISWASTTGDTLDYKHRTGIFTASKREAVKTFGGGFLADAFWMEATGVNANGEASGYYTENSNGIFGTDVPVAISKDTTTVLPLLPGGTNGRALAINDDGWIAGWSDDARGISRAVVWTPEHQIIDLQQFLPDLKQSNGYGFFEFDKATVINKDFAVGDGLFDNGELTNGSSSSLRLFVIKLKDLR